MEILPTGLIPANAISRDTKTNGGVPENFKPLDEYGDWVSIPAMVRIEEQQEILRMEVKDILLEQIDAVIPRHWVYRRCVQFQENYLQDTGQTTVRWIYCPSLDVIEMELYKTMRKLTKVLDPMLCRVIPLDDTTGWYNVVKNVDTPGERRMTWMFTTYGRAQAWIKRNGGIEC